MGEVWAGPALAAGPNLGTTSGAGAAAALRRFLLASFRTWIGCDLSTCEMVHAGQRLVHVVGVPRDATAHIRARNDGDI